MPSACVEWPKARYRTGYGAVKSQGRMTTAHRVVYEREVGPIPEGMDVHHRCQNRGCVNPDHLQLLTRSEHIRLEGKGAWTECSRGHDLTDPENVYRTREGRRCCRACRRARQRKEAA